MQPFGQIQDIINRGLAILLPLLVFYTLVSFEVRQANSTMAIQPSLFPVKAAVPQRTEDPSLVINTDRAHSDNEKRRRPALWHRKQAACTREGPQPGSFLLIFMGHSGSSAIMSELRDHPQLHIEGSEPVDHFEYEFNTTKALEFTREFFKRGQSYGKIPGFKLRPWHIGQQPDEWRKLVKDYRTRIVWQYRENILKQAVGEYSFKHLNDSSVLEGLKTEEEVKNRCKIGAGCQFEIKDFGVFHRILKDCLHSDESIMRSVDIILNGSTCVHAMPYEDYLYSRKESMRRLREFLGIDQKEFAPTRFKATGDNLCNVVSNWNELCRNFYGCHAWRHMFDDEETGCRCDFSSGHVRYCGTEFDG